jgi:uncharacterized protein YgiM (DUF1202 family)
VAPDFYRYRTDYYYEQKSDKETSTPSSRWKNVIDQGIAGIQSILSRAKMTSAKEGKGLNLLILSIIMGLVLMGGLLWIGSPNSSPPTKKSQSQRGKIVGPATDSRASTESAEKSVKNTKIPRRVTERRPESRQTREKPSIIVKQSAEKAKPVAVRPRLAKKPSQVIPLQLSEPQTWESLPQTAEIRLGPGFHTPILQLIRRGTRLKVVGRQGDWLKLQLRNGSTGWIYHSLAQPERELVRKPLTALKGSKGTSGSIAEQSNIINKMSSPGEVRSPSQKGAETYVSLPKVAKIRSGPSIHAPVLQLIQRGTQLQVVGKKGTWLKLQLRNGSIGWIYHSLAQPEKELLEKPLTVLKGSRVITKPFSIKTNVMQNSSSAEDVVSTMQNGSEVALVYPE